MATLAISDVLARLSRSRPIFHSEADFQHALAWELQRMDPAAEIRLEKQVATNGPGVHLDLLARSVDYEIAIELKYKTKKANFHWSGEQFLLREQSATDIGRHDFLKDIERLERYVAGRAGVVGHAILLTNEPSYWTQTKKLHAIDAAFRIHEGRDIKGPLTWGAGASEGTKRNREAAIALADSYKASWKDYSAFDGSRAGTFRYLALCTSPS